ncbi:MAG: DUF99 family protein [Candidatus Thermoplasmatota archaeon]|nr:DUF99 family protein [Candidatus Thermoplasmatota archaeon]
MKKHTRIAAFDDGKFTFREGTVPLVCIIARLPAYVEGAIVTKCTVDGMDATETVCAVIQKSRFREQIRAIMLDGIACGGFNVFDIDTIGDATALPVVCVTRRPPDITSIRAALSKHFDDWEYRYGLLTAHRSVQLKGKNWKLYATWRGMSEVDVRELIDSSIVRGNYPEALRQAHIFASALTSGESRGKA